MRKVLRVSSLFFALFLLSGCGVDDALKADPDLQSLSGLLVEQKTTDSENGTHFISDESNEKFPVRSLTINLSSNEYLNNKVQAMAMLNNADDVYEITGLSVIEILSDKTSQKKLIEYKDTEAGFKLKYIDDWKVANSKTGDVIFEAPLSTDSKTSAKVTIEQIPFSYEPKLAEDGSTDSPLKVYFASLEKEVKPGQFNKIGVDAMDAVKFSDNGFVTYYLYRAGIIYKITFIPADPVNDNDENVFNQMMSEFQFIAFDAYDAESDPDAGDLPELEMELTTFESLPYSFGGKYPSQWYYSGVKTNQDGILHHYGFSEESVTADNEIISLEVLSGSIPNGNKIELVGKEFVTTSKNGRFVIYTTVDGQNYKVEGPDDRKDLITVMAASIFPIQKEQ